jgi:hypothetical protein
LFERKTQTAPRKIFARRQICVNSIMEENMRPSQPKAWQCVLICWGTKYGAADINRLVKRVADQNTQSHASF